MKAKMKLEKKEAMISEVSPTGFSTKPTAVSKPMWVGWGLPTTRSFSHIAHFSDHTFLLSYCALFWPHVPSLILRTFLTTRSFSHIAYFWLPVKHWKFIKSNFITACIRNKCLNKCLNKYPAFPLHIIFSFLMVTGKNGNWFSKLHLQLVLITYLCEEGIMFLPSCFIKNCASELLSSSCRYFPQIYALPLPKLTQLFVLQPSKHLLTYLLHGAESFLSS